MLYLQIFKELAVWINVQIAGKGIYYFVINTKIILKICDMICSKMNIINLFVINTINKVKTDVIMILKRKTIIIIVSMIIIVIIIAIIFDII